jgi:dimethylglycine catabolism A
MSMQFKRGGAERGRPTTRPVPLLSPGSIGGVSIRNRTVMPPMTTRYADDEGFVTDRLVSYYAARARGGVGLVTVEMASPEPVGRHRRRELAIWNDRFIAGLRRLTEEIKSHGARASIQLGHGGGHTRKDICGEPPIAPSAVPHWVVETTAETVIPREISRERIEQTIEAFAEAAERALRCGFDMVEIHAAHGYLISQFLCPFENQRRDDYGGSLENRARFGLEIIRRIRERVPGFPVVFRCNANDYFPGGLQPQDGVRVCQLAAAAGADAVHVTAGHYRSQPSAEIMIPPMAYPEGVFLDYAAEVRRLVDVPVIGVGRLGNPEAAVAAVASGKVDFVALGRPLLADPEWVTKVEVGRPVRRCVACNTCVNDMRSGAALHCLVNPATGRERECDPAALPEGERIAVIGAGPAGLSYASLVAARNDVTVFERTDRPGGALRDAGRAPLFQEVEARAEPLEAFIEELVRDCRELGVTFRYGMDVGADADLLAPFSRVVIATGAGYRFGLGPLARWLLQNGRAARGLLSPLFRSPRVRAWLYYRARRPAPAPAPPVRPGQSVSAIGDASRAGKALDAIAAAFDLAYRRSL